MTTHAMSCELFQDRLMAYLEDETDAATRSAVERHAVTCGDCGAVLADLRKLRIDAANLPELAPSRDLWAGIATRIDTPVVPIGTRSAATPRDSRRAWRVGVMAASLAGAVALGYVAGQRPGPTGAIAVARQDTLVPTTTVPRSEMAEAPTTTPAPDQRVAQAPRDTAGGMNAPTTTASGEAGGRAYGAQLVVVANLTADYDREIARLKALLDDRRNQLDPVTVAIIERNLLVIDAAITESKQAIARDPASRFLLESLNQSLRMKVELMRTAAMLPSRT